MPTELTPSAERSRLRNIYAVLLAVTLAAIGLIIYDNFDGLRGAVKTASPAIAPVLSVSAWRGRLQLKWDPSNEVVREAQRAEVLINDGGRPSRIALTPESLRNGNIVYTPQTNDISFQLRTLGAFVQTASVRYIGGTDTGAGVEQAGSKPEPFGDKADQTGTADRVVTPAAPASVSLHRRNAFAPRTEALTPAHHGVLTRMKHGLAKLWPVHHTTDDGGQP